MKTTTHSLEETFSLAKTFVASLTASGLSQTPQKATIVGLYGDLGAGKTAFSKGVAQALGISEEITSPTFVIEKIYRLVVSSLPSSSSSAPSSAPQKKFDTLIHIDAYRLTKSAELTHLGFKEIAENPKNLILIEWPEHVADILPADHQKILFSFVDEKTREIEIINAYASEK